MTGKHCNMEESAVQAPGTFPEAFKSSLIPSSVATRLGRRWSCYRGLNSKSLKGELGEVYAVSSRPRAWHTWWLQEGFAQARASEGVSPSESQVLAVASEALHTATLSSLLLTHSAACPQPLLCTHDGLLTVPAASATKALPPPWGLS